MNAKPRSRVLEPGAFLRKATAVASHFGFRPAEHIVMRTPKIMRELPSRGVRDLRRGFAPISPELLSVLAHFYESGRGELSRPILFYQARQHTSRLGRASVSFGLDIVGNTKSLAEALLIKTALAILSELGVENVHIRLNSLGDRDSANRFSREVQMHLRKNWHALPSPARTLMRDDCLSCLSYLYEKGHAACEGAPRSVDYLSESGRKHLSEFLEFLESMSVPYAIDGTLLRERDALCQSIFHLYEEREEGPRVFARGGRYDDLGRRIFKTSIPAVGLTFSLEGAGVPPLVAKVAPRRPKIFFIQVGPAARRKSLEVIEILRQARIPLDQALGKDKLSIQMEIAQKSRAPWTLIMGHKEALEEAVIVRDMETRAQQTIPIALLSTYLRKEVLK